MQGRAPSRHQLCPEARPWASVAGLGVEAAIGGCLLVLVGVGVSALGAVARRVDEALAVEQL